MSIRSALAPYRFVSMDEVRYEVEVYVQNRAHSDQAAHTSGMYAAGLAECTLAKGRNSAFVFAGQSSSADSKGIYTRRRDQS